MLGRKTELENKLASILDRASSQTDLNTILVTLTLILNLDL